MVQSSGNSWSKDSTAQDITKNVDLTGKLAVVTGGSEGIGKETARALGAVGATLFIGARTPENLTAAQRELETQGINVSVCRLDLMDPASVEEFAQAVRAENPVVDILVNNAGIMACPLTRNSLGIESQLATNFVGHALLVSQLAPALVAAGDARVVSLTSVAHHLSPVVFDDLNYQSREYEKFSAYGQSKTACVLLAVKVATELGSKGVTAHAVHPGFIMTDLGRFLSEEDVQMMTSQMEETGIGTVDYKSVEAGAATSVWAATASELKGSEALYLEDCSIADRIATPNTFYGVMDYALDRESANRIWEAAEYLLGRNLPL